MNSAPFFIVGSGRSGTTLLRMILSSHSRLSIPPETYYLAPLLDQLPIDRSLSPDEVERAVKVMTGHYRWPDMGIDSGELARDAAALVSPKLRDIVEIAYAKHLAHEGKARWGDKTPPYIQIVPRLAEMFPGARFIHLLRDGRDVAKSFQSVGWYGPHLHRNMIEWTGAIELDRRWRKLPLADRILVVRYEDLVRQTEKTTKQICEFLGEEFEPQMLGWEEKVDRLVPRRELYIHTKLQRKPSSADIERWRREMSSWEMFISEAFMGKDLARAGYECKYRSGMWAPVFFLARSYCRLALPALARLARVFRFGEYVRDKKQAVGGRGGA